MRQLLSPLENLPLRWPLTDELTDLRGQYAGMLASQRRLVARLKQSQLAGMDPLARAIREVDPDSPLADDRQARRDLEALVKRGTELLRQPAPDRSVEWIPHMTEIVKVLELAHATAGCFCDPGPRRILDPAYVPLEEPGNVLDQLNQVYYRLRGSAIYEDFITAVSHDPLQARADAARFEELARSQPDPLRVLEVGVGGGQYAADFLEACRREVQYCMGDISPRMLRDALAHGPLKSRKIEVLGLDELDKLAPYELVRHNELYTDLPHAAALYLDGEGRLYRGSVRGTFPESLNPPGELHHWLYEENLDQLRDLELEHLDWEVRFERVQPDEIPYAHLLDLAGRKHVLFSHQIGAARFLEASLARARTVRVVDYGIPGLDQAARTYEETAQVIRRYGASATRDLLFDMLARLAESHGRAARVVRLEEFVRQATGEEPVLVRFFAGVEGASRVSRVVSGPQAPFPLDCLREYPRIRTTQAQTYAEFLEKIPLRLSLPGCDWPHVETHLEKLALDLDFEVNAIFRRHTRDLLDRHVPWFTAAETKQRIQSELVELGFGEPRRPTPGRFWVLEVFGPTR